MNDLLPRPVNFNAYVPVIGIDLGTTFSVVATLDRQGRPVSVGDSLGEVLTPSALLVEPDEIVFGREATKAALVSPHGYAECFKRDMGQPFCRLKPRGVETPPEVLSGLLLEHLKRQAELKLGPISEAVITVPAFFDESRRKSTEDAGRLAGFTNVHIINEPTAAALAFGMQQSFGQPGQAGSIHSDDSRRILVYDLGGGTFDVTILEIEGRRFRTLATDGDVRLGGKDFDERLFNHLAEKFRELHGVDPRGEAKDAARLWQDSQSVKHTLSERLKAPLIASYGGLQIQLEITRREFETLGREFLERTEITTSLVLQQAQLDWNGIDVVLAVGGSTRMPMVLDMLRRISGREPHRVLSPDEAIAHGAALYAGILQQNDPGSQTHCELINVNSHSLGVVGLDTATGRRINAILIPKNTPLPHQSLRIFHTSKPDQRSVRVRIIEGESQRPAECMEVGECVVRDLPPGLPQGTPITLEYSYNINGRISVSARLPNTRQSARVEIERHGNRELGTLQLWRDRLQGKIPTTGPHFTGEWEGSLPRVANREALLKRLDAIYATLGRAATNRHLPAALAKLQTAALENQRSVEKIEQTLAQNQAALAKAYGPMELVRCQAALAKDRTALEQARIDLEFSWLVLGREVYRNKVKWSDSEPMHQEAMMVHAAIEQLP